MTNWAEIDTCSVCARPIDNHTQQMARACLDKLKAKDAESRKCFGEMFADEVAKKLEPNAT